ncbi:unnamed protein product [Rotaria sordida]|uniref:Uncharacterized protein n=1 Tax=Rotaria sordida TaxID=392033 RepID=A0A819WZS2_9BILA|nr:unnamed protein product [Rotaria sordida]
MIEETMPDYDISSHFIYSIAKFLVMLSHDTLHSKQVIHLNNFEKILNDFHQSSIHDEIVYHLDTFSYLTSLNEYFKLLL